MRRGKKYLEKAKLVDRELCYHPKEAMRKALESSYASFDETVEVHYNLGIDPRHADQQLRGTMILPEGTGTELAVVVVTQGDKIEEAEKAGADVVGSEDIIEKIQKGWMEFDILIASPDMMSKVGRLGKQLGAKGLMPNPKSGTVTTEIGKAVEEFKKGKVEYRNDKLGLIHLKIGKKSFDVEKLLKNFNLVYDTLAKAKPSKSKGQYIKSISLSTSMGPGVYVETSKVKWSENK